MFVYSYNPLFLESFENIFNSFLKTLFTYFELSQDLYLLPEISFDSELHVCFLICVVFFVVSSFCRYFQFCHLSLKSTDFYPMFIFVPKLVADCLEVGEAYLYPLGMKICFNFVTDLSVKP